MSRSWQHSLLFWLGLLVVGGLNRAGHALEMVSEEVEIEAGQKAGAQAEKEWGGVLLDRVPTARVEGVGRRLVAVCRRRHLPFTFKVLNNAKTANAFACPGGPVYITLALLRRCANDDELAFVLGHEVAHTDREHGRRAISREVAIQRKLGEVLGDEHEEVVRIGAAVAATLITLGYSQEQEREADTWGVRLVRWAGFDPHGALSILRKIGAGEKEPEPEGLEKYLRTHPPTSERIAAISQQIKEEDKNPPPPPEPTKPTARKETSPTPRKETTPAPAPKPKEKPESPAGKPPASTPAEPPPSGARREGTSRPSPFAYLFVGLAALALGGALYFWYATRPRPPARPKGRPGPEPAADRSAGFQPALGRPGPEPAAWLEVIRPTGDRQRCPLTADSPLVIGRVPSADLCLDDEQVSWRHAQIERTGETFSVADLDSTNGTLVNGQRVSQSSLRDGDRIQIGRTVLTFRQGVE